MPLKRGHVKEITKYKPTLLLHTYFPPISCFFVLCVTISLPLLITFYQTDRQSALRCRPHDNYESTRWPIYPR